MPGLMLKKRVMEDLDALLADLQSTTSQISTYQHQQQHQQQSPQHQQHQQGAAPHHQQHSPAATATITVEVQREAQESPPPPLPPPPSQDVLDSVHSPDSQPIYEPTNVKQMHTMQTIHNSPGHTSSHKVTQQYHYQTQTNFGGAPPPVPQQPPPHPALMHQAMPQHQPMPQHQQPQVMPKPGMSALSHNLSELDTLLQDLNSAQFMAEVDRRNAENIAQSQRKVGPPVAPKPGRDVRDGRASVDNLLDQLESSLPPTESNQVNQSMGNQFSSHQQQHHMQQHHHQQQQQQQFNNNASFQQASTATRELDDLMNSLSEFKIKENQTQQPQPFVSDPPYATPHKSPKLHSVSPPPTSPPPPISPHAAAQMTANNTAMAASSSGAATASSVSSSEVNNIVAPPAGNAQSSSMSTVSQAQTTTRESLDTMLGTLQTDMSRHGVTTVAKGHCAACNKPIIGQVITALGRIWHPEHFSCAHCREELGTQNFFERDGQPFCERDYHQLFSPRCAYCNGPILDKCVTALDKTWHPEHFFCAACGRMFGDDGFHEKDGKAFCRDDYFDMFAPKCGGCGRAIMDNYISALNRQWHPECFICQECHMPFGGGSFFDHDGMPYCETHYHAKRGSLCAHCQKPITGRCITAMYKKFHPEHFVCAFCLKQLNKGTFKEQNDKPYCHPCFVKLFG